MLHTQFLTFPCLGTTHVEKCVFQEGHYISLKFSQSYVQRCVHPYQTIWFRCTLAYYYVFSHWQFLQPYRYITVYILLFPFYVLVCSLVGKMDQDDPQPCPLPFLSNQCQVQISPLMHLKTVKFMGWSLSLERIKIRVIMFANVCCVYYLEISHKLYQRQTDNRTILLRTDISVDYFPNFIRNIPQNYPPL